MHKQFSKLSRGAVVGMGLCLAMLPLSVLADTAGIEDGVYDAYNCAAEVSDRRIELEDGTATFYGYWCELSNPRTVDGIDGAVLLDGDCDGEGEEWRQSMVLLQTRDGGLSMLTSNWGDHYERCETP